MNQPEQAWIETMEAHLKKMANEIRRDFWEGMKQSQKEHQMDVTPERAAEAKEYEDKIDEILTEISMHTHHCQSCGKNYVCLEPDICHDRPHVCDACLLNPPEEIHE